LRDALLRVAQHQQQLAGRLQRAQALRLTRAEARLQTLGARIGALDPRQVLQRGYAWVTGEDGRAIVSAAGLVPGARIAAVWSDGSADAVVETVRPQTLPMAPPASPDAPV
jgi:exodeoxyribonuclease VII large subunit